MKTKTNYPKFWEEKEGKIIVTEGENNLSFSLKDMTRTVVMQKKGDYQDVAQLGKYKITVQIEDSKLKNYIINEIK